MMYMLNLYIKIKKSEKIQKTDITSYLISDNEINKNTIHYIFIPLLYNTY